MANQNLFNTSSLTHGGGMDKLCDCVTITLKHGKAAAKSITGYMAQNVDIRYTRQPQQLFELGSCKYYYVDGRPTGTLAITNVIGPTSNSLAAFLELGTDMCNPDSISMNPTNCACDTSVDNNITLTASGVILVDVQLVATSESPSLQGTWTYMFADLNRTA